MLVCAPWATIADLPDTRPGLADTRWDEALLAASDLLYVLSGRRWAGTGCRARFVYDGPACTHPLPQTGDPLDVAGRATNSWDCGCPTAIRLPDRAGLTIETVTAREAVVDPSGWQVRRGWLLRFGGSWPAGTTIDYAYGLAPPPGGKTAAVRYALELGKAWCGDKTCALPARTRQVTRQGVSIEMADPAEFLEKGRTGLVDVDTWLAAVNPVGARQRPGVWTPETAVRGQRSELSPSP